MFLFVHFLPRQHYGGSVRAPVLEAVDIVDCAVSHGSSLILNSVITRRSVDLVAAAQLLRSQEAKNIQSVRLHQHTHSVQWPCKAAIDGEDGAGKHGSRV